MLRRNPKRRYFSGREKADDSVLVSDPPSSTTKQFSTLPSAQTQTARLFVENHTGSLGRFLLVQTGAGLFWPFSGSKESPRIMMMHLFSCNFESHPHAQSCAENPRGPRGYSLSSDRAVSGVGFERRGGEALHGELRGIRRPCSHGFRNPSSVGHTFDRSTQYLLRL